MRFAKRTDTNHKDIRDGLRTCGFDVRDHSGAGGGIPDLCVMVLPGISLHLEVKDPTKPKEDTELTKQEKEWFRYNGWNSRVVFTLAEAIIAIRQFKEEVCKTLGRAA